MNTIKSTNPTFTITYKLIGHIVEESYETKRYESQEALEDDLRARGEKGQVSYYLYGKPGMERRELNRMAFI